MDKIKYTVPSISTRLMWLTIVGDRYFPENFDCVDSWENVALKIYETIDKKDMPDLIRQCKTVGLDRLVSDLGLQEVHKENQDEYKESLCKLNLIGNGTPSQFKALQRSLERK